MEIMDTLNSADKSIIDRMSYTELLAKWRHAPIGSQEFAGKTGKYFVKVMNERKVEIGACAAVEISKEVGW